MRTIGEQAKAFRDSRGWTPKQMAAACKTSRQNIETLESVGDRIPKYIKELAKVMGTTVDVLMEGRYRVGDVPIVEAAPLPASQAQRTQPEPDQVMAALRVLAESLGAADKVTRSAVAPMLSILALEPDQLENVIATLGKLLPRTKLARASQDDPPEGEGAITALLPHLASKENKSAKRSSVQGGGRT